VAAVHAPVDRPGGRQHLDDLVVRRSNLGDNPERAVEMAVSYLGFSIGQKRREKRKSTV